MDGAERKYHHADTGFISVVLAAALWIAGVSSILGCSRGNSGRGADRADSVRGQGTDRADSVRLQLSQMTDDQKLLLFEHVPLGATLSEVRQVAPELSPPRWELRPGDGLSDAQANLEVLELRTRVEFNFNSDRLYSVNFGPLDLRADSGDALFDRLVGFYSGRFGPPIVSDGADSPYFVRSRFWPSPWGEVGLTNSLANDRRLLGWGYQPAINTRQVRRDAPN